MSDLDDVVEALAARIRTGMATDPIAGRTFAYAPDSIDPPALIVLPSTGQFVSYDSSWQTDDFELVVMVLLGTQHERAGQQKLAGYFARSGVTSLREAIYGDKTLGATVSDLRVVAGRSYGDVEWSGQLFFGAELIVEVYA